jgi:uncharacterized membrane protein
VTTDIQTIARGDASRILRAQRVVARGEEEWRALWAAHAGPSGIAPPVDFSARIVAAVFQGQRPSAGFETTIVGARDDDAGKALVVQVDEHPPSAGRSAAHVLVSPFHIVSLPRFDGAVRFEDAYRHANEVTQAAPVPERADVTTLMVPAPSMPSSSSVSSVSSTGLTPEAAGALAYLAGPLSGALLLILERTSRSVRFHAWQAFIGLGGLGLGAILCLGLAFLLLLVSPRGFSVMRWVAGVAAVAWVLFWVICLVQAFKGRQWKLPLVGDYADRLAGK